MAAHGAKRAFGRKLRGINPPAAVLELITGYIMIGIRLEERDLFQQFGDQYHRYRQHVLLPGRQVRRADVWRKACVEADQ